MSLLSPRLQLKVAQKQILTPGLVQMVTVLQLNRLELKEMITQEIVKNPVLEEATEEAGEEVTPEELLPLLEAEPVTDAADKQILEAAVLNDANSLDGAGGRCGHQRQPLPGRRGDRRGGGGRAGRRPPTIRCSKRRPPPIRSTRSISAPFSTITWIPATGAPLPNRSKSRRSRLSSPRRVTLGDHLRSQLSVSLVSDEVRDAAESIIGNLDEDGYLSASLEEIAAAGEHQPEEVEEALQVVQSLDPAGVGARNLRECLLLQIESVNGRGGVAWQIVSNHLRLLETRQYKEMAKLLGRPHGAHRNRRGHDPPPQSAAGPALFRRGRAGGRAGRLFHQGRRRLHHPDE